jgi:hypothetical protein
VLPYRNNRVNARKLILIAALFTRVVNLVAHAPTNGQKHDIAEHKGRNTDHLDFKPKENRTYFLAFFSFLPKGHREERK